MLLQAAAARRRASAQRHGRASGVWLLPLLPLLGFVINGAAVARRGVSRRAGRSVGVGHGDARASARDARRSRRDATARTATIITRSSRHRFAGIASIVGPRRARRCRSCSRVAIFLAMRGAGEMHAPFVQTLLQLDAGRRPADRRGVPARPALDGDDARHHRRRHADPPLQRRLHAGRPGLSALLRVPQPVRLLHAACWCSARAIRCCSSAGKASGSARTC